MQPSGLYMEYNFISKDSQASIVSELDQGIWRTDLKRRTQHYGSRYDYKKRQPVYDVPPISGSVVENVVNILNPNFQALSGGKSITSVIVNEYMSKQCIAAHTDSPYYGDVVMTLSLGDSTVMTFRKDGDTFPVLLEAGTAVAMTGDVRHNWTHETQSITQDGYRRISVTARCENNLMNKI